MTVGGHIDEGEDDEEDKDGSPNSLPSGFEEAQKALMDAEEALDSIPTVASGVLAALALYCPSTASPRACVHPTLSSAPPAPGRLT